ncbi:plant UBX domain-containing protein 4 isoform X2 [Coffea arabica]|uniref:Plant UBX domain-containing protein 4 isoform X2 n=1 Tax=Coffea arabica TaxID=13443 RepID=A0ABM4UI24_COFAR
MVLMTTLMCLKNIIPVEKKSGMLVQDPFKANDIDAIFNQASQAEAVERAVEHLRPSSSSRSFTGTARLLSDDGPLPRLDDPANASFLESIGRSECPRELQPANKGAAIHVNLLRKEENYTICAYSSIFPLYQTGVISHFRELEEP